MVAHPAHTRSVIVGWFIGFLFSLALLGSDHDLCMYPRFYGVIMRLQTAAVKVEIVCNVIFSLIIYETLDA